MAQLLTDQRPRGIYPLKAHDQHGGEEMIFLELIDSEKIMRYVRTLRHLTPEYGEDEIFALLFMVGWMANNEIPFSSEEVIDDPHLVEAAAWYCRVFETGLAGRLIATTGQLRFEYHRLPPGRD